MRRKIAYGKISQTVAFLLLITLLLLSQQEKLFGFAATRLRFSATLYLINDPKIALNVGNYYFNGGAYNLTFAKRAYQRALKLDPEISLAHYQLSRIHFLRGNFYDALREINQELVLHPEIPNSYYVRGLIQGYQGSFSSAAEDFNKFIELVPGQWAGYNDLAWILARLGKFKEMKEVSERAFKTIPGIEVKNPWLWISLGIAHLNLREYNNARQAFSKALALAEKMSPQRFWSAYPGNHPAEAERAYRQFLGSIHLNLGLASEKLGAVQEAKTSYKRALSWFNQAGSPERMELEEKIKKLEELK